MIRIRQTVVAMVTAGILSIGMAGCNDTSSTKTETKTTTPNGSTTVTNETTVKKTGENPPPAKP